MTYPYFRLSPRSVRPLPLALSLALYGLVLSAAMPSLAQSVTPTPAVAAQERAADQKLRRASQQAERRAQTQAGKSEPASNLSRVEARSQASQMAAGFIAAETALAPAELAIAEQVHTGVLPCELGAVVTLESDAAKPGYFNMSGKNFRFRMVPVVSATGAIRLEDRQAGAVWLQLANKSMLMNQKAGKRMADECMSPVQATFAQGMKTNPAPGLLDGMTPAAGAVPAASSRKP